MNHPERPGFNKSVRKLLAKEVAKTVHQHTGKPNSYEELESDLFDLFCDQYHCREDGYEIAKSLDSSYGYSPNAQFVEALDCTSSLYSGIIDQQSKEWVLAYNVNMPLAIGDKVKFPYFRGSIEGEITRLFPNEAKYGIWSETLGLDKKETSYHLVEFEKVEKL